MQPARLALALVLAGGLMPARTRGEIPGAQRVTRPPLDASEVAIDDVMASMEIEGDAVPRFALRSQYTLLLRTELVARGADNALYAEVHVSVAEAILEQLVAEEVIVRDAERAHEDEVSEEDLASERALAVGALHGRDSVAELLQATGESPEEFDRLVRRRVIVRRYLVAHASRLIEPTDADLRQAYLAERYRRFRDGGVPFAAARRFLRDDLRRAQAPTAARQYLQGLGSRVRERVFNRAGRSGAEG